MTYDRLNTRELQGTTKADYLVAVDAHFRILDGTELVYDEPCFPVIELARGLATWLDDQDRGDFEFDSMSFEEVGSVAVRRTEPGWVFSSVFNPDVSSSPVGWKEVERCVCAFLSSVEMELVALGLDPGKLISG